MERNVKFVMTDSGWEAHLLIGKRSVAVLMVKDEVQAACQGINLLSAAREWIDSGIVQSLPRLADNKGQQQPMVAVHDGKNRVSARNDGFAIMH